MAKKDRIVIPAEVYGHLKALASLTTTHEALRLKPGAEDTEAGSQAIFDYYSRPQNGIDSGLALDMRINDARALLKKYRRRGK